jgi:hypothetical protein
MDLSRLGAVFGIATEDNVARWLAVAARTTVSELRRAVTWATHTEGDAVLEQYEHAMKQTNDAQAWVALKAARRQERPPRTMLGVDPDLVVASRWYLANVKLPKFTGFQRVKNREAFTCESPLCNRTTLRCQGHHAKPRVEGGGNEDTNAVDLCIACHLRGVHAGGRFVLKSGHGEGPDVWTYPNGRTIHVF